MTTLYREARKGHKILYPDCKKCAILSLHRDSFVAKVPGLYPVLASGNTTSPYCRAVMRNFQLTRHIQYMRKITASTILILIFTTCTNYKRNDINDCEIISDLTSEKSKVELINSVVFDTTAILVHGTVIDRETKEPLINAEVKLYNNKMNFFSKTNSSGEFKIYENIKPGKWDLLIEHTNYNCMIIKDLIKSGGQWFIF